MFTDCGRDKGSVAILQLSSTPVLASSFLGRRPGQFGGGRIRRSLVCSTFSSGKPHGKISNSTLRMPCGRIACCWHGLSRLTLSIWKFKHSLGTSTAGSESIERLVMASVVGGTCKLGLGCTTSTVVPCRLRV